MPALASGPGFLHPVGFYLDLAHLRYPQTFLSSLSMVVGPMEEVLNQPKCKMTIFFCCAAIAHSFRSFNGKELSRS